MPRVTATLLAAALACVAAACSTSSHVLIGTARPAISPESVRVYYTPPPKYEEIATISASSQGSLALTSQQNMDKAMQRMKAEAAKVGANGILLQGVRDTGWLARRRRRQHQLRPGQRGWRRRGRELRANQQRGAGARHLRAAAVTAGTIHSVRAVSHLRAARARTATHARYRIR